MFGCSKAEDEASAPFVRHSQRLVAAKTHFSYFFFAIIFRLPRLFGFLSVCRLAVLVHISK